MEQWRNFIPTIPFFIIAVADAYFLIIYLRHGVGEQFIPGLLGGPLGRTACAGMSLIFYFSKCILPVNLLPIYPQWVVTPPSFTLEYLLKFLPWLVMAFGFWWLLKLREQPWARTAIFGFGYFFLSLLPFVGWRAISFMRFGWVMDHFLYVPILGLIGLAAAAAGDIYDRIPRSAIGWRIAAVSLVVAIVAIFTIGSNLYAATFVNRLAYWTYCSEHNWVAWPAHNNRGNQLLDNATVAERRGYHAEASALFARIEEGIPDRADAQPGLHGSAQQPRLHPDPGGQLSAGRGRVRTALSYTPDFESAQLNLAHVLQLESAATHNANGIELSKQGRYKEAEAEFRQALQSQPDSPAAEQNLAQVLELEASAAAPTPVPVPAHKPHK